MNNRSDMNKHRKFVENLLASPMPRLYQLRVIHRRYHEVQRVKEWLVHDGEGDTYTAELANDLWKVEIFLRRIYAYIDKMPEDK